MKLPELEPESFDTEKVYCLHIKIQSYLHVVGEKKKFKSIVNELSLFANDILDNHPGIGVEYHCGGIPIMFEPVTTEVELHIDIRTSKKANIVKLFDWVDELPKGIELESFDITIEYQRLR